MVEIGSATGVLCDRRMSTKVKGKFYKTLLRPTLLNLHETAAKVKHIHQMSVAEMWVGCVVIKDETK